MPAPKGNKNAKGNNGGRPSKYTDEMPDKVDEYIEQCEDRVDLLKTGGSGGEETVTVKKMFRAGIPTLAGFADYVGIAKETVWDWSKKHVKFSNALGRLKSRQEKLLVEAGLGGSYNSVIAKLLLSTNFGYQERKDITSKGNSISGLFDRAKEEDDEDADEDADED